MPGALGLAPFDQRDRVRRAGGQREREVWQVARQVLQDLTRIAVVVRGMAGRAGNVRVILAVIRLCVTMVRDMRVPLVARWSDPEHPLGIGAGQPKHRRKKKRGNREPRYGRA